MAKSHNVNTSYLDKVYYPYKFKRTINKASRILSKYIKINKIDAIAFTGTSGAALAYPLSYLLDIHLICVRKSAKDNHHREIIEGCLSAKKYIIVDDFFETGKSINRIISSYAKINKAAKLLGIYLYDSEKHVMYKDYPIIK